MEREKDIEMVVEGLVMDPESQAPIVILKEPGSGVCLPIWIGLTEATAIASAVNNIQMDRPMTHDLLTNIIKEMGAEVKRVTVTELKENTFLAVVEIATFDNRKRKLDCRPSDAIAIAVRVGCPIFVSPQVLAKAQVTLEPIDESETTESRGNFADVDKEKWEELLREMDPDDFKYKM